MAAPTVHWVGAGLSTSGPALAQLADSQVVMWGRDRDRLAARVEALGLTGVSAVRTALMSHEGGKPTGLAAGDVVVSMLPGAEHERLARAAIEAGAHFACTSYTSPELAALAGLARDAGVVVLTEAGLDPGIDHLMAHALVEQARAEVGEHADTVRFTSYCGGLATDPGPFRYKFSWAPFGVLNALRSPATCLEDGAAVTHQRPWTATSTWQVGEEQFEVYPNRDSLPFIGQYRIPQGWRLQQFVRGTLRSQGWLEAWETVFQTIESGTTEQLRVLASELAGRYPTSAQDRDRVVLEVDLQVSSAGRTWRGRSSLDLAGGRQHSAMARCVTEPVVFGVQRILAGALPPGLHRAVSEPGEVGLWLEHLRTRGIPIETELTPVG